MDGGGEDEVEDDRDDDGSEILTILRRPSPWFGTFSDSDSSNPRRSCARFYRYVTRVHGHSP
jgi:hypothetical protein